MCGVGFSDIFLLSLTAGERTKAEKKEFIHSVFVMQQITH
jgi:hypothetical protein